MEMAGLQWDLPEGLESDDCLMLWLGEGDAPALTQLMLTCSRCFLMPYHITNAGPTECKRKRNLKSVQ